MTSVVCSTGATTAAAAHESLPSTPARRQLGASTDDAAIFYEDTVDRVTAQCLDASPSALALLSPQHLPSSSAAHVDVTEYDACHLGSLSSSSRKSGSKGRLSSHQHHLHQTRALHDVTNTSATKLSFTPGPGSKSPTPKATRGSAASHGGHPHSTSHNSSLSRTTPRRSSLDRSPSAAEPAVPLADFEALQRERNRYEKMYEHQRALYEEMAEKHAETYQALQDKIIEVVALSTRNEEGKRFIRQLKREMSESRTRVMDMQNKALEEAKSERSTKVRYEALIQEHERKYERLVERHETKLAGMESLIKDLTCLRGERDRIHVSQLDSLLKAAYSKSTALFSDLLRQGKQLDLLYDAKGTLETQVDQLRREKRDVEAALREERRRMAAETERLIEQIEEQQQSILNLRQMLIRTMDNRDNVFAYSRGPRRTRHFQEEEDEEEGEDARARRAGSGGSGRSSIASSSSSSPPSSFGDGDGREDVVEEVEEPEEPEEPEVDIDVSTGEVTRREVFTKAPPLSTAAAAPADGAARPPVRAAVTATRPVISASGSALSSNSVVAPRRTSAPSSAVVTTGRTKSAAVPEVPPLPLTQVDSVLARRDPARAERGGEVGGRQWADENSLAAASGEGRARQRPAPAPVPHEALESSSGGSSGGARAAASSHALSDSASTGAPSDGTGSMSRRRLDFSTALAAVTEKRRRDRAAREEGGGGGGGDARAGAEKENSRPPVQQPHRTIVRSGAVGSIPTARRTPLADREEEEEGEPRLFPRNALRPREV